MTADSTAEPQNNLERLALAEETVGRLYDYYAAVFPEHEEFWKGMAMEEADHATAVYELLDKADDSEIGIWSRIIPDNYMDMISSLLEQLLKNGSGITFRQALENALKVENTMAEHGFYNSFSSASEEMQGILDYLGSTSESHCEAVKHELRRLKTA